MIGCLSGFFSLSNDRFFILEMRKQRKTYGIRGFMEYQAVIKIGRTKMKLQFSDGTVSAMGENPATYTTDNYMIQHAIENSVEFGRGLIEIVRTTDLGEEVKIERGKKESALHPGELGEQAPAGSEAGASAGPGAQELPGVNPEAGASAEPAGALNVMEFASNDEAKDYLEQNFGLVRSKLRNRDDICKAGLAHGVEIKFV